MVSAVALFRDPSTCHSDGHVEQGCYSRTETMTLSRTISVRWNVNAKIAMKTRLLHFIAHFAVFRT